MPEEIEKLSTIAALMAEIAAANASIEAMKVENDDRRSKGDARYTTGKYKGMTVGEADGVDMGRWRNMPDEQRDKFRDVNNADVARNELAAKKKDEEAYQLGRKRADINAADKHKRDKLYGTGSTGGTPNPVSDPNAPQTPEAAQRGATANDPSMGGGDTASPDFDSNKSEGYWAKQAGGASKGAPKPNPVKNVAEKPDSEMTYAEKKAKRWEETGVSTKKTEFEAERARQDEQAQNLIDDKINKREDLTATSRANQDAVDAAEEKKYADGKATRLAERTSGQIAREADPSLMAAHDKARVERQKKRDYNAANPSMLKSMTSSDPKTRESFDNTLLGRSVDEVKEIAQPIVSGIISATAGIVGLNQLNSLSWIFWDSIWDY
ncbi:unnamed protein product [marine sediment metagenome]|uniref:Uncharacterized protein n=1 Tax=marine sediment metagenome TaxID=412755 RepID=X0ZKB2_9ZZZZ